MLPALADAWCPSSVLRGASCARNALVVRHCQAQMVLVPLPQLAAVIGVGVAAVSFRQFQKSEEEAQKFATMKWAETPESEEGDGCVLLGEEAAPDGYVHS